MADQYALYGKRRVGSERLLVQNGGVYTVILKDPEGLQESEKKAPWAVHAIVPASTINIFWQRKIIPTKCQKMKCRLTIILCVVNRS